MLGENLQVAKVTFRMDTTKQSVAVPVGTYDQLCKNWSLTKKNLDHGRQFVLKYLRSNNT